MLEKLPGQHRYKAIVVKQIHYLFHLVVQGIKMQVFWINIRIMPVAHNEALMCLDFMQDMNPILPVKRYSLDTHTHTRPIFLMSYKFVLLTNRTLKLWWVKSLGRQKSMKVAPPAIVMPIFTT